MVFGNISICQQQESHKQKEYMVTALWGGGGRYTNTGHLRFCYVTSFSFLDYACLACTLNATYSA